MKVLQTNGLKAFMASIRDKFIKKEDTVEVETVDIDNIPTQNSNNLVKSGGVYTSLADKLTEPSSNLTVGKYFRIASIDADGHAVLECVDPPVQSVSAAGTALTPDENGNVNIPAASITSDLTNANRGLTAFARQSGFVGYGNGVYIGSTPDTVINDRRGMNVAVQWPIGPAKYDYAVKRAMTDGIGAAWTDTERITALLRMGCTVDDETGFVKWTASE